AVSARLTAHTLGNCSAALIGQLPVLEPSLLPALPKCVPPSVSSASLASYDFLAMETPAIASYIPCSRRFLLPDCDTKSNRSFRKVSNARAIPQPVLRSAFPRKSTAPLWV